VDDTRRANVSIASVRLPDGVEFEQWVLRVPAAIMVLMLDDQLTGSSVAARPAAQARSIASSPARR
jgi:selenophosphate synthetase-related protein